MKNSTAAGISPESNKFTQPKKIDKTKIAVIVIMIVLAGYVGYDVFNKVKVNLQTKYFNAGGQFIIKDLIGKSENCQKVKVSSGEEFVRTSCLSGATQENPFTQPTQ